MSSTFAPVMPAAAINVWHFFHCRASCAAIFAFRSFTRTIGMCALLTFGVHDDPPLHSNRISYRPMIGISEGARLSITAHFHSITLVVVSLERSEPEATKESIPLWPFHLPMDVWRDRVSGMRVEAINLLGSSRTKTESETIKVPWRDSDGVESVDLRENPAAIAQIAPALEYPPLAGFLAAVNGEGSIFTSIRAKVWEAAPTQLNDEAAFCFRLDLVFAHEPSNFASEQYEEVVRRLVELWMKDPADSLTARLEILPCHYNNSTDEGAGLRIIFSAKGTSPEQARTRWVLGLMKVQQALLFVSRSIRQNSQMSET